MAMGEVDDQKDRDASSCPCQYAIAIAKQRAKIPLESDVEIVPYPPRKTFYELLSDSFPGSGDEAAMGAWMKVNFTKAELDALRMLRGPMTIFHRGEPLALMPFTFLR